MSPCVGEASVREQGFTLVELMVAMLLMAIVLATVGPALYGSLAATSSSKERSVATGLAVAANEQIRSLPYYDVAYQTLPSFCSTTNAVKVTTGSTPLDTMYSSQSSKTVGSETYQLERCVYWVDATGNNGTGTTDTGAYKQSVVTVTWSDRQGSHSITQYSDIYPGGEGPYTTTDNNFPPQTAPASSGTQPSPPINVTATTPSGSGGNKSITVSWSKPATAPTPDSYIVEYNTSGVFTGANPLYATSPVRTTTSWAASSLTPGTNYYFQVISIYQGTQSLPSSVVYSTTSGTPSSTCYVYGLVVNPTTAQINQYGYLQGTNAFTMSVNASSACTTGSGNGSTIWVYYTTSSSTLVGTKLSPEDSQGAMLGGQTLNSDGSQMVWTPGNHSFTVYTSTAGATPGAYSPSTVVQVNICEPNPATGLC